MIGTEEGALRIHRAFMRIAVSLDPLEPRYLSRLVAKETVP